MTLGAKVTIGLWGAAIFWDLICPEGQTVSEAVERGLNNPRTEPFVLLALTTTALHLMRSVDPKYDLYSIGFNVVDKLRKKNHE
ncbi:hypothetical protein Wildcat_91 [Mycobacterium phage Wildcat]|uniref:Uncharacterized protein n=4 Tax=Mycobacterium virus Wildcat TaxID=1993859 RepID=Q19XW9_9CAUD|nr:hypothetical protein Wildcat_91 [Mycobacterium phage Wildcat]AJD82162.1 hypothetical protein COSMO_90 [Mycobacterium phage Cosmo]AQT25761.2 hypothetical protein EniyanLRS_87 [Mycobacterium phage EniyanLRS]QGJ89978.1 hypothetical protein PBI_MARYV_91 [Mycobacterium phage MaryV]WKR36100.1 hypothetical protein [Mycobacterium phage Azrael100]ABE67696.1 hypothetical protein Wildcat_91 [Mycobacterium phage Wildcat]